MKATIVEKLPVPAPPPPPKSFTLTLDLSEQEVVDLAHAICMFETGDAKERFEKTHGKGGTVVISFEQTKELVHQIRRKLEESDVELV